ncbi:hypothetical protein OROHE_023532 [Orobanche hederae]
MSRGSPSQVMPLFEEGSTYVARVLIIRESEAFNRGADDVLYLVDLYEGEADS